MQITKDNEEDNYISEKILNIIVQMEENNDDTNYVVELLEISKYEMRLLSASIVYCEPNISSTLKNNKLDYNVDGTNFSITFPNGLYSLKDINTQISLFTLENNSDASMISYISNEANSTIYLYSDTPNTIYASHANSIIQILGFAATDITLASSGYVNGGNQANLNTLQTEKIPRNKLNKKEEQAKLFLSSFITVLATHNAQHFSS